jgi:hypothetical protein
VDSSEYSVAKNCRESVIQGSDIRREERLGRKDFVRMIVHIKNAVCPKR